ncbi:RDD family protein [Streptococcus oricebi]|uniref:RDD family protein n=1 Tax=Streptococcus oricebi TaxID=1547447 RepID=A0ABS5B644_9STRE|nr:RDD family protein [Streptococcus oricebi]MBP2623928.1 RDD family protein [Streptococcus oricebi]
MKIQKINKLAIKKRSKEVLIDLGFIWLYLLLLFLLTMGFYTIILGKIPRLTESQSQLTASLTSVLPIILLFTYLDYGKGSFGKRWAGLELVYRKKTVLRSLVRSTVKFLPWQLGHMGTIRAIYKGDSWAIVLTTLSLLFMLLLISMTIFTKDKRHLGDLLAGSQVQEKQI